MRRSASGASSAGRTSRNWFADDRWPAVIYLGRITGKPEAIGSSHGFVTTNALVATEVSPSVDWPRMASRR